MLLSSIVVLLFLRWKKVHEFDISFEALCNVEWTAKHDEDVEITSKNIELHTASWSVIVRLTKHGIVELAKVFHSPKK